MDNLLLEVFTPQIKLDNRIYEAKGIAASDVFDQKITALHTELGELANNHRGFKYWSEDQEPRTEEIDSYERTYYSPSTWQPDFSKPIFKNPLLEEYVDGLHFVVSLGVDVGVNPHNPPSTRLRELEGVEQSFNYVHKCVSDLWSNIHFDFGNNRRSLWEKLYVHFMDLGKRLGFTDEQILEAYMEKNQVNHDRQNSHY